jgi:arylsulfatase A-like enzyme/4-amino-4-deoxy-L-arabinose transferase-like glycosyltransferase
VGAITEKRAKICLVALVIITIIIRLRLASHAQIFFDGCGYIMHAWSIAEGHLTTPYWFRGMDHYYPPLYPFFIYLSHFFITDWIEAAKLVSVIFSTLLLLPVYELGKRIFSREIGLLASAILVGHPLLSEVGSNVYSEPVFLFFMALAMLLVWRIVTDRKVFLALPAGLCLGLAYLARTQSIVGLVSFLGVVTLFRLLPKKISFKQYFLIMILGLAGFYLLAFPYDLYCYKKEGIWGLRFQREFFKKGYQFKEDLEWYLRERTLNKDATSLLTFELARTTSPKTFVQNNEKIYLDWVWDDFKLIWQQEIVANTIAPPLIKLTIIFLFIGLIMRRDHHLMNRPAHLFLVLWVLPLLIAIPLTISVIDRYFLAITPSLAIWAAAGTDLVRRKILSLFSLGFRERRLAVSQLEIWLIALVLLNPQPKLALSAAADYDPKEIEWLKNAMGGASRKIIISPYPFVALYSGNYWYMLPIDNANRTSQYAQAQQADYLLVEEFFYSWLQAPDDFASQLLNPFSKPGLKWLDKYVLWKRYENKPRPYVNALYQVIPPKAVPQKPANIILISIDTLRADHLSSYGYFRKTSPNLDRFAAEGVRFEKVISQAPKTAPSHMTMLTSLYPEVHQVHSDYDTVFDRLDPKWEYLPGILKKYGYRTAAFTGGVPVTEKGGFDAYFDIWEEGYLAKLKLGKLPKIVDWLKQAQGQPSFLFLHTFQVHDPYCPPAPYNKLYDPDYKGWIIDDLDTLWLKAGRDWGKIHNLYWGGEDKGVHGGQLNLKLITPRDTWHLNALYDGAINYTDMVLGKFLEDIKTAGILDNTLVIITSDHGEEFMEHGSFLHRTLYRETLEVPLIMRWPGRLPKGRVVRGQVRLIDLMPTMLDLVGIPIPTQTQGVSLTGLLAHQTPIYLTAYSEYPWEDKYVMKELFMQFSVADQNWKLYTMGGRSKEDFFFIKTDPYERIPLLHKITQERGFFENFSPIKQSYRNQKNDLKSFKIFNERHNNMFGENSSSAPSSTLSDNDKLKLKALGYIK